jgi:tryptophan 2,3-dioxygenase
MEGTLEPILPGEGASDYERYLRTDELLALQKTPEEQAHRDELLFQTVHQSSELWLKHACFEVETATALLRDHDLPAAIRLLRRATLGISIVTENLQMLEQLSPWEYQDVRRVLGHGSGFDSPGFRRVREVSPPLGQAFNELLREAGLTIVELHQQAREHEELYQVAELLTDWDERLTLWRVRHFKVVERVIGFDSVGTQGTPVELLGRLINHRYYPELWSVRNTLTQIAGTSPAI